MVGAGFGVSPRVGSDPVAVGGVSLTLRGGAGAFGLSGGGKAGTLIEDSAGSCGTAVAWLDAMPG